MTAPRLDPQLTKDFLALCEWVHHAWLIHKSMETSPRIEALMKGRCKEFLHHLSRITQEYSLQQIAKLHDPAVQAGKTNLTLDYVIRYGNWDAPTAAALSALRDEMERLVGLPVKQSRNKVLAHNDVETVINETLHGAFADGADETYFEKLQEFMNLVHDKCFGGPAPLSGFAWADTQVFIETLAKGGALRRF